MESNGMRNRIHISQDTANLLEKAGKGHWLEPREDVINAKGKGEMKTFWLLCKDAAGSQSSGVSGDSKERRGSLSSLAKMKRPVSTNEFSGELVPSHTLMSQKTTRLVDWNVEVLARSLRLIVARRGNSASGRGSHIVEKLEGQMLDRPGMVLDEIEEIIKLPKFDSNSEGAYVDPKSVLLPVEVLEQLRDYVTTIAESYRENRKCREVQAVVKTPLRVSDKT